MAADDIVKSDIPARLDRLPWGRFHTLVVAALGITWILDGLEVTLAGSLAGALKESTVLRFTNTDMGLRAAPISPAQYWAPSSSAGSPTGSAAKSCSLLRSPSTSSLPRQPPPLGT